MSLKTMTAVLVLSMLGATASAAPYGLQEGSPELMSVGPLTFGADGILFIADPKAASVIAVDTRDTAGNPDDVMLSIEGIDRKFAGLLGTTAEDILINDMAVNPASGNIYFSVSRGRGPDAAPVILRVSGQGEIEELSLENVAYDKADLPNPPADEISGQGRRARNNRMLSITDMAFIDGQLFVAGISNEEFSSRFRTIQFPFESADEGATVEIYHGSHGRYETQSPVRTFATYDIGNTPYLLAAYTCTPLVKIPVSMLQSGETIMGDTVAELGNRNTPLDMVVYGKDGGEYILMANDRRGVMKISTDNLHQIPAITERVPDKAGLEYETLEGVDGVVQLDRLNTNNAITLVERGDGYDLTILPLP